MGPFLSLWERLFESYRKPLPEGEVERGEAAAG